MVIGVVFDDTAADFGIVCFTSVLVHGGAGGAEGEAVLEVARFFVFDALHRLKIMLTSMQLEWHFLVAALANKLVINIFVF